MPRLWSATIESHRREVREAIVEATATLVAEHGLLAVTMSQVADATGIGRATLYKYFPSVEAILDDWHEREVSRHLQQLRAVAARPVRPAARLTAVLEAYALIRQELHRHDDGELAAFVQRVHRGAHVASAQQQLHELVRALLTEAAAAGDVRDDIAPAELASYCLHALEAASRSPSRAALRRLLSLIQTGLHPPR